MPLEIAARPSVPYVWLEGCNDNFALLAQWQSTPLIRERSKARTLHGARTGSSTDRAPVYETGDVGSIPSRCIDRLSGCYCYVCNTTSNALVARVAEQPALNR